jgi:hypothetical protein
MGILRIRGFLKKYDGFCRISDWHKRCRLFAKLRSVEMKKILILIAAVVAASALAALIRAGRNVDGNMGYPYDDSPTDYLGI